MSKWTKTRRDPGRTYQDEEVERLRDAVKRVRELVSEAADGNADPSRSMSRLSMD